jgi:phosphoglycerol geranylgeranyltransferase
MPDDTSLVKAYSLTAAMYGFKLLYLEAGSGAENQVDPELIKSAKTTEGLTMLVGGGIRTPQQAQIAAEAGADWIVTGTLTEDATDLADLREKIHAITNTLSLVNWEPN